MDIYTVIYTLDNINLYKRTCELPFINIGFFRPILGQHLYISIGYIYL